MSHFTVLVVTDGGTDEELTAALQPFHEFECTGTVDEFVQDVDVTDKAREEGLESFGLNDKRVSSEAEVDRHGEHKYGFAIMDGDAIVKAVDRSNPNKKWDWWRVGGRWSGQLLLKDGEAVDSAQLSTIDVEELRAKAERKARRRFDDFERIVAGRDLPKPWAEFLRDFDSIDAARTAWHAIPVVKDLGAANDRLGVGFLDDAIETFGVGLDTYVARSRAKGFEFFAVLIDGEWHECGDMGWWGCVSDEKNPEDWTAEFNSLIARVGPDQVLTVVDCHI